MHLGMTLIEIVGLHDKEIKVLVNINLLDIRNNIVQKAILNGV